MRAFLNQARYIPFAPNQSITTATISIMKLSDGTLSVNNAAMTSQPTNNIWTYAWTTPRATDVYQAIFNDGTYQYTGPIIEVGGGIIFTVVTDGGNTASTFKTDLTEATNDYFVSPAIVRPLSGVLDGQCRRLATTSAYNGTTKFVTLGAPFTAAPAAGVTMLLITG